MLKLSYPARAQAKKNGGDCKASGSITKLLWPLNRQGPCKHPIYFKIYIVSPKIPADTENGIPALCNDF